MIRYQCAHIEAQGEVIVCWHIQALLGLEGQGDSTLLLGGPRAIYFEHNKVNLKRTKRKGGQEEKKGVQKYARLYSVNRQ